MHRQLITLTDHKTSELCYAIDELLANAALSYPLFDFLPTFLLHYGTTTL